MDCWNGYKTKLELKKLAFILLIFNHMYSFVDPTEILTQKVERLWGSAIWKNMKRWGMAQHHLKLYLAEFIWKHHIGCANVFKLLLKTIAELCLQKVLVKCKFIYVRIAKCALLYGLFV